MNFTMTSGIVALAAITTGAFAGSNPLIEFHSQEVGGEVSAFQQSVSFPQFNDLSGTRLLTGVEFHYELETSAKVTAENDAPFGAPNFAVVLNGAVQFDFVDLVGQGAIDGMEARPVSTSDGVPGSGPDFLGLGSFIRTTTGSMTKTSDLSSYVGSGSVDADVVGSADFFTMGTSQSTINVQEFAIAGSVTIKYTYENIPTPGAAALFGLAGLGVIRRRR